MKNPPIIILGAGRSGTNMLRDLLCQVPGVGTWPCDEINYIWRHGNAKFPTDEFQPENAGPKVCNYIRKKFDRLEKRFALTHVVEKTCANTLRVGFIHTIFPNAKFIHIIRDGRDVAISAQERWTASIEPVYLAKKALYVPFSDLFYYASKYMSNRIYRLFTQEKRLAMWGPKFNGMEEVLKTNSLPVSCAIQWQYCVEIAEKGLSMVDNSRITRLKYEDFVKKPEEELSKIFDALGVNNNDVSIAQLTRNVRTASVGRWQKAWDDATKAKVQEAIGGTLKSYDYEI